MCAEPAEDFKMSASPKKQVASQPVVKIAASSAISTSPVARALFQLETQGMPPDIQNPRNAAGRTLNPKSWP